MSFDVKGFQEKLNIPSNKFSPKDLTNIYTCLNKQDPAIKLIRYLGSGEQGTAFLDEGHQVTKVSKLYGKNGQKAYDIWVQEVQEGQSLGKIRPKIAPEIYRYVVCDNSTTKIFDKLGVIQMETLVMADKGANQGPDKDYGPIRKKFTDSEGDEDKEDFLELMTLNHQFGFIKKFLIMAKHGYVHMDNHIENLGYVKEGDIYDPILFDFGFIQKFKVTSENILFAIALSCFIILEHQNLDTIEKTLFFRVGIACLFGKTDEKQAILAFDRRKNVSDVEKLMKDLERFNLAYIKKNFHLKKLDDEIHEINSILQLVFNDYNENSDPNLNIKFGALCCLYILPLKRLDRYETPIYDLFYHVRVNTFKFNLVAEDGRWNTNLVPLQITRSRNEDIDYTKESPKNIEPLLELNNFARSSPVQVEALKASPIRAKPKPAAPPPLPSPPPPPPPKSFKHAREKLRRSKRLEKKKPPRRSKRLEEKKKQELVRTNTYESTISPESEYKLKKITNNNPKMLSLLKERRGPVK